LKQVEAQRAFQRVESQVATELGIAKPLYAGYLEGFLLHNTTAAAKNISPARLQDRLAIRLRDLPFVADVYTATELSSGSAGKRPYFEQFQHSFRTGRSPDLMIRFQPNVLFNNSGADHGTGHGTPYDYDTHVPLVFMGDGIKPGQRAERVKTVDLAPTLSVLIGVPVPGGVDGHALGGLR
jgi:hypothetical protein